MKACISTGPQQQHGTFYSIRTEKNAAFLRLTNEKIHLHTAHSELLGYWSVEYEGLNQVFHDPNWIEEYISKAMPMLTSQDNEVTYLPPWSKVERPPKEGGVYELASFQMRLGSPAVWGEAFQAAVSAHAAGGHAHLVGVFHSEFGRINKGTVRTGT
ncbi:unnamed protein product, partial [Coregonus sp. 'balchen']